MVDLENIRTDINYETKDGENIGILMEELDFQRLKKIQMVPALDIHVRETLRFINEPEALNSETASDRRDRLANLMCKDKSLMDKVEEYFSQRSMDVEKAGGFEEEEEFYTPASEELIKNRQLLISYSDQSSRMRLLAEKEAINRVSSKDVILGRRRLLTELRKLQLKRSQIVGENQISEIKISPMRSEIACGSWAGDLTVVDMSLQVSRAGRASNGTKISGLDWTSDGKHILACTHQGEIRAFDSMDQPGNHTIYQSDYRLARIECHPAGHLCGTTSFDKTWKLLDISRKSLLLSQEGHASEVFGISFHCDGALVSTSGLDGIILLWDLRCGKSIMSLQGHKKPVYTLDWSPKGYQLASGGGEGTVKIWDIRKKGISDTILAHNSIVSQVKFSKDNGSFLASSGYDKIVKLFNGDNWAEISVLRGHLDKVMTVDICDKNIYSAGWDRSINKWAI